MEVSFQARIVRFHPPLPMRQKGDQLMMKGDLPQVPSVGWRARGSLFVNILEDDMSGFLNDFMVM